MIRDLPNLTPRRETGDLVGEVVGAVTGLCAAALFVLALVIV